MGDEQILDAEGAAELLQVSTKTLLRLARQGEVPGRKVGRSWRFERGDLIGWLRAARPTS
ncbi:MAG: helix-turn-helix domain-containing protein, partial [Actinomycetota bacterium]|nr:helix-turn-helix domain-containing protein [Actinomycetota bacterium]